MLRPDLHLPSAYARAMTRLLSPTPAKESVLAAHPNLASRRRHPSRRPVPQRRPHLPLRSWSLPPPLVRFRVPQIASRRLLPPRPTIPQRRLRPPPRRRPPPLRFMRMMPRRRSRVLMEPPLLKLIMLTGTDHVNTAANAIVLPSARRRQRLQAYAPPLPQPGRS